VSDYRNVTGPKTFRPQNFCEFMTSWLWAWSKCFT